MEERQNNLLSILRSGQKVICPKCSKGTIKPFPETAPANKAHSFNCSNEQCDWYLHWDPVINIE